MRFLFVTDSHFTGRNPSARLDNYRETALLKLIELVEVARQEKVQAIFHGGDFFHTPRVSTLLLSQIARILTELPCPLYVVPGNHDLIGHNIATLEQTHLGLLASTGLIKILTRETGSVVFNDLVAFHGQEYYPGIDSGNLDDYRILYSAARYNILVAHGFLVDKPFHPDVRVTLIDDICTAADLILVGHYHPGFGKVTNIAGVDIINPGSMGRIEATLANFDRLPQYVLIDVSHRGIETFLVPFAVARPSEEVIDRTHIEVAAQKQQLLADFRSSVQQQVDFAFQDIRQAITSIQSDVSQEAVARALDFIAAAENLIDDAGQALDGFIPADTPVFIVSVELKNFQSYEDARIEFGPGFNVIVGSSDQGKSAVLRALRWVFYNEPRGNEFIRTGAKETCVTVTFSNGVRITRKRTRSSAGSYILEVPGQEPVEFTGFGIKVPVDIITAHQSPRVVLTKDLSICLNFAAQLEGPFLLSQSPATRSAVISSISNTHLVDLALKEAGKEANAVARKLKELADNEQRLQAKLECYGDMEARKEQLDRLQDLWQKYDDLLAEYNLLSSLWQDYTAVIAQVEQLQQLLPRDITELSTSIDTFLDLASLYQEYCSFCAEIKQVSAKLVERNFMQISSFLQQAEELQGQWQQLQQLYMNYQIVTSEHQKVMAMVTDIKVQLDLVHWEIESILASVDVCPFCNTVLGRKEVAGKDV